MIGFVLILYPRQASAETYDQYTGWKTCVECHDDISRSWRQTRHANAFSSLPNSGQQDLPACLGCHVVGYGDKGGFLDQDLTPELAGVQCESCHGPGMVHIDAPDDMRGTIHLPGEKECRSCHTTGQDPNFDFRRKIVLVHGDITTENGEQPAQPLTPGVNSTLFIDKTIHEPAPVREGSPVIVYTRIKNSGKEKIHITDVISS